MKSVIEIPVILSDNESFFNLFKSNLITEQKSYQDFYLVEWQLDVSQSVFFYLIKRESSDQLINILKQVVPKAPAVLFKNELVTNDDILDAILERFDTPVFVFSEYHNDRVIKLPEEILNSIEKITHFILKHISGLLTTTSFTQEEES